MQEITLSKVVAACGELTPEDMTAMNMIHPDYLKHLENQALEKKQIHLSEYDGEYLVSTVGAKIIKSNLWELKEHLIQPHCFRYKIVIELTDVARASAKKI